MAVLVGALALGNIGYHLVVFRDCPEAFLELQNVPFRANPPNRIVAN